MRKLHATRSHRDAPLRRRSTANSWARSSRPGCAAQQSQRAGLRASQEAMIHVARVSVVSRHHPRRVDAQGESALEGACASARSVERREGAVGSPQVAVTGDRVTECPRDRPSRVDAGGGRTYRSRRVDRGDGAVRSAQQAMRPVACVNVVSRDRPRGVDAPGPSAREAAACARARGIDVVMVPSGARRKP